MNFRSRNTHPTLSTLESGISLSTGINVTMGKIGKNNKLNVPTGINVHPGKFDEDFKVLKSHKNDFN